MRHHISTLYAAMDVPERERSYLNISATKMRHHISTLYAAMDVPARERSYFYCHMGHSADIKQTSIRRLCHKNYAYAPCGER